MFDQFRNIIYFLIKVASVVLFFVLMFAVAKFFHNCGYSLGQGISGILYAPTLHGISVR